MIPGVEHARRRRRLNSENASYFPTTRSCSPFCHLNTSNYELDTIVSSSSFVQARSEASHGYHNEKLVEIAREAKQRLDDRLSAAQWKSENKRGMNNNRQEIIYYKQGGFVDSRPIEDHLQRGVQFGLKKRVSNKLMKWAKMWWKDSSSSSAEECAICLDQFKNGDNLMQLRCAHKFHSKCLLPWLHYNSHCPCCRLQILTTP